MGLDFTDSTTYSVSTTIEIAHSYHFVENVFDPKSPKLAELYKPWKRCLAVVDYCVYNLYGEQIKAYFKAHQIPAIIQSAYITEDRKSVETLQEVCKWMTDFDIIRREPLLVIGGGLVTDVVGLAGMDAAYVADHGANIFSSSDSPAPSTAVQRATFVYQQPLSA